jgi:uncharacterized membrane protein YfcA
VLLRREHRQDHGRGDRDEADVLVEFRIVNALKTLAVVAANLVASAIFLVIADLDWVAVLLLAAGSVFGGYVGARIGRYLPANVLRVLIVLTGVVAAIALA